MIILATPFSIYSIRGKCLMGIKMGGEKTSSFDTFQVKAISKAFPSATHINLQNAITGTLGCVLLL